MPRKRSDRSGVFEVSNAGTESVNGVYIRKGVREGRPVFVNLSDEQMYLDWSGTEPPSCWAFCHDHDADMSLYYSEDDAAVDLPPTTGWKAYFGREPAPVIRFLKETSGKPKEIPGEDEVSDRKKRRLAEGSDRRAKKQKVEDSSIQN